MSPFYASAFLRKTNLKIVNTQHTTDIIRTEAILLNSLFCRQNMKYKDQTEVL